MRQPAKPLTTDQLWSLAVLLKQWRDYIDGSLLLVEGRRWKRKGLMNIYENYRGMVQDFHLVNALRVSTLRALEMAYKIKSMKGEGNERERPGKPAGEAGKGGGKGA
jgi:hypothetical protein